MRHEIARDIFRVDSGDGRSSVGFHECIDLQKLETVYAPTRSPPSVMSASLPPRESSTQEFEHLDGLVERVTFHNAESGFCVLRLQVKGERELVTLVGVHLILLQ